MLKKGLLFVLTGFLIFKSSIAQIDCAVSKLSKTEKSELEKLWKGLRKALKKDDRKTMSIYFQFPFKCAICEGTGMDSPYVSVTKNQFISKDYTVLSTIDLLEKIKNKNIFEVLSGAKQDDGSCGYSIGFVVAKPSSKGEGVKGFFTIKKINGAFKAVSIWTVP